ncbi:O-linked N-acetylglucosamine transferase, SPINDLY family protein [Gellertiella hungarica]|uniref:Putative O-linked N-acetylglucosamine transferase (SPINDLY family) n=1 Tax=Gellertiella hungarica TaxID=1572859 RepID=A0A7W6NM48_9HYPH|nr:hypothetical protein [Gellertiella hungarica]MBB4066022.1 putative O-linked N-acetylglucosamine transferase (SPINDLY family) [Gellertiella hungarica]
MRSVLAEAEANYKEGNHIRVMQLLQPLRQAGETLEPASLIRLAVSLTKLQQFKGALEIFLSLDEPDVSRRLVFLKMALNIANKLDDSAQVVSIARSVLALEPTCKDARVFYRHHIRRTFDYAEIRKSDRETLEAIQRDDALAIECELLHDHIMWCGDERINFKIRGQKGLFYDDTSRRLRRNLPHSTGDRIRVGYFSSDLSENHATLCLLNRAFDLHDPARFDIRIYDLSPEEYVDLSQGFRRRHGNRIHRIADLATDHALEIVRSHRLDIAIDLKGHTDNQRGELFNRGLAPVQAAYLGFPGSGVGIDCDYIIADRHVCPPGSEACFEEKFCWLPESYQVNDNHYRPVVQPLTKRDLGLPEDRIVFMSANNPKKISFETLGLWLRVLDAVPGSLLWMVSYPEVATQSIRAFFLENGVEPERLVFVPAIPVAQHLARLGAGDLGLDSFPCNGHTTTSDKLWAGLPVVTRRGRNFSSRVSESLLNAVHLGELVAEDDDAFVALCASLAADPERLRALKSHLITGRHSLPLFNTERTVRHLEDAFATMVERSKSGMAPEHFAVPPRA